MCRECIETMYTTISDGISNNTSSTNEEQKLRGKLVKSPVKKSNGYRQQLSLPNQ